MTEDDADHVTNPDWEVMGDAKPPVGDPVDRASTLAAVRASILQRAPSERPTLSRHILLRKLGAGGSGIVYEAYDPELGRKVAIKLLKRAGSPDASTREARLRREAQATAKVSHPNVISIYDVGTYSAADLSGVVAAPGADSGPLPTEGVFIVMELVDGLVLRDWMEREHSWQTRLDVIRQAGQGLAAAHAQNLVHRDFKPDNVFVGTDGAPAGDGGFRVRVLDFGLALAAEPTSTSGNTSSESRDSLEDDDEPWPTGDRPLPFPAPEAPKKLTQSGVAAGTPAYMSPEQHMSQRADARSDQFSFCATAFEVLAGRRPFPKTGLLRIFEAKRVGRIRAVPKNTGVPKSVWAAIRRGLSPRPEDRWASMDELLAELSPRRSRKVAVAAIVGVALSLPISVAVHGYVTSDECERTAEALEDAWTVEVQEGLESRLRSRLGERADRQWRDVKGRIDEYVEEWSVRRGQACRNRIDADSEAAIVSSERRVACLERRRLELQATLDVLRNEDAGHVAGTMLEVIDSLQPLEGCDTPDERRAMLPPPGIGRIEALEILAELRRVEVLGAIGAQKRRYAIASEAVERAIALGHGPTLARALRLLAMAQWDDQDIDGALASLDEALILAERADDEVTAIDVMLGRANILGTALYRFDETQRLVDWVLARSEHPFDVTRALRVRGILLEQHGKSNEAVAVLERALDLLEREDPGKRSLQASILNVLAGAYASLTQYDQAMAAYEKGLRLAEEWTGSGPTMAFIYNNMGGVHRMRGEFDQACARFQEAHDMFESYFGPNHEAVAMTLNNIGACQVLRRRPEEALATHREALRVNEAVLGPDHVNCGYSLINIADLLITLGRPAEAREPHERAIRIWTSAVGPEYPLLAVPHAGLAELELAAGNVNEAREHVRQGLELVPPGQDQDHRVRLQFAGARIEFLEDPDAARRKVAKLRDDAALRLDPALHEEVDAWWAEHGRLEIE